MKRPVTLTDILDGHAVPDISCLDRIYLNGHVPRLQTSGQVVGFLHHRGFPVPSQAEVRRALDTIGRHIASLTPRRFRITTPTGFARRTWTTNSNRFSFFFF